MTALNDLNGYLDDEAYTVRVGELRALLSASIADTAGSKPCATLHDDGYWTWKGTEPYEARFAGWRMDVYAAPPAPSVADAVGASEGQEPVAWMTEGKYPSPRFIIGNTDPSGVWKEKYVPLFLRPSAEIAALRERIAILEHERDEAIAAEEKVQELHDALFERIAGMEKDAEKRRDALIKALAEVACEYVADRHLVHYSRQWEAVVAKEKKG